MSMDRSQFYSPQAGRRIEAPRHCEARFAIGDVVRHRLFDFRTPDLLLPKQAR